MTDAARPIPKDVRQNLVTQAKLAGMATKQLGDFAAELGIATVADLPEIEKHLSEGREKNLRDFWWVGPGSLRQDGQLVQPGERVRMTEPEAEGYGAAVTDRRPPPPSNPAKRKAGYYRIEGEGGVRKDGEIHAPGTVIHLSEREARGLPHVPLVYIPKKEAVEPPAAS